MSDVVVEIKQGKLRGKIVEDVNGGKHFAFLGIPYGKPPVRDLRFKNPQPAEGWSGIRDALEEGSPCKSFHSEKFHVQGDEDCLYLNVYTPQIPSRFAKEPLAVIVWIPGGGFTMGSASAGTYGPNFLLTENIVFVSLNYRLGIFGFISFDDSSIGIPGNAGLKDQILALKWIKENISSFGGDPSNITIFGESAGAASVHYLILSSLTRDLFNKAIMQSGVSMNTWAVGQCISDKIAELLGIPGASERDVYGELLKKTTDELFELQNKIPEPDGSSSRRPWVPVIEKDSPDAVISEEPIELLKSGRYNKVPLLMGYTSREGLFARILNEAIGRSFIPTNFELEVPFFLNVKEGSPESRNVAENIRKFYFGNQKPSEDNIGLSYVLQTDSMFVREIQTAAKYHARTSPYPVYFYRFSIDGTLNLLKTGIHKMKEPGACHADDLGYIFHNEWTPEIVPNSTEDIIRRSILHLWTNFAKYGNPNSGSKDNLIKVEWQPLNRQVMHFLDIGENLTVGVDPDRVRIDFWADLFSPYLPTKDS